MEHILVLVRRHLYFYITLAATNSGDTPVLIRLTRFRYKRYRIFPFTKRNTRSISHELVWRHLYRLTSPFTPRIGSPENVVEDSYLSFSMLSTRADSIFAKNMCCNNKSTSREGYSDFEEINSLLSFHRVLRGPWRGRLVESMYLCGYIMWETLFLIRTCR